MQQTNDPLMHQLDLCHLLKDGAIIITPNNRLSQQILQSYDARYRSDTTLLTKPLCFPYTTFLQFMFKKLQFHSPHIIFPKLLSDHQQRFLWHTVLQQSHSDTVASGLADAAQEAWQRCQFWQIDSDHFLFSQNEHTQVFQVWFKDFLRLLTAKQFITIEQIPKFIIESDLPLTTQSMIWTCFDEYTPLQLSLQKHFANKNCPQFTDDLLPKIQQTYCFAAVNPEEEYQQLILWLQACLARDLKHIAVVVPNLETEVTSLQRIFSKHFTAEEYNISYGTPLSKFPLIGIALQWLALDLQHVQAAQIRALLHSPFLGGGQEEYLARSKLLEDRLLMKESRLEWGYFLQYIATKTPRLHTLLENLTPYPKTDHLEAWTGHFKNRLREIIFPGEAPLNSANYQYFNRFLLLLDEFMSLNAVSESMSATEALKLLEELAQNVVFQIKKPQTAITVLGLLEASGCSFDSIWVMGMTDQCLPKKTKFSPFLPIQMQKEANMPYSSAQSEFLRAEILIQRLANACDNLIFSYAQHIEDRSQLGSQMILNFPPYTALAEEASRPIIALECYPENYLHPMMATEKLAGGTALLASQAKCPFQAFASFRLKASPIQALTEGIDPLEKGQLLHSILENFWKSVQNQAALFKLSAEELDRLLEHLIHKAIHAIRPSESNSLIYEVEFERLKKLIHVCLEWEKQRAPFEVHAIEQTFTLPLASLPIQVRVDRIDQAIDASAVKTVIDYKTSLPLTQPWLEERPEAPQLLLYALLDKKITTLLFLQLKNSRLNLSGLSAENFPHPGIKSLKDSESWEDYQLFWTSQLTLLAEEIKQGFCEPKPKRVSLCQQCAFDALCRLQNE